MRNIFTLFFVSFSLLLVGQEKYLADDFTIVKSELIEPKSDLTVLGKIDDKVYVIQSAKTDNIITYDATSLKQLESHPININLDYGKVNFYIEESMLLKDKFHLFFTGYDKKNNKYLVVAKTYNLDGTSIGEKVIASAETENYFRDIDIAFLPTKDQLHFAFRLYNIRKPSREFVIEITWFDLNLNIVGGKSLETGLLRSYAIFHSETVSNNMHYACVLGDNSNPYKELNLYVSYPKGGVVKNKLSIENKDVLIGGMGYNAQKNELILSGFYGAKGEKKSKLQGYFYRIYDLKDATIKHEYMGIITAEMFEEFKDNRSSTESRALSGKSINFKHNNTLVTKNGDVFIIYDEYSVITVSSSGVSTTSLNLNDIFVIHFNSKNEFKYADIIERETVITAYKYINNVYSVVNENQINLYFGQSVSKSRLFFPNDDALKNTTGMYNVSLIETSLNSSGISSRPVFVFPVNKKFGSVNFNSFYFTDEKYNWFFTVGNRRKSPFIINIKKQ